MTTDDVTSYDLGVNGDVIHVVYETAGTIQHKQSTLGSGTWSAATQLGTGSNPSLTFAAGGVPMVSMIDAGSVVIAKRQGDVWSTVNLGNPNGTTRAMIRTDGAGTTHLLVEGSGTGGRGSIDYASFNGTSWSAFSNLGYGWYDTGSGNYYHQPVLGASSEGGGYTYTYEFDNWGGRASWSNKSLATSGVTPGTSHDYGWNSSLKIADGGYLASSSSLTRIGYSIDGNAYVQSLVSGVWSSANLGTGTNVAVYTTGALFESGTAIKKWDGTTVGNLLIDSNAVEGHLVRVGTNDSTVIAYLTNGSNQLMIESVILAVPPAISSQPVPVTINSGATATFTVAASGTSPTFQWYEGMSGDTANPIPSATGTSFTTPALIATTSYWVRASNVYGTADSNTVTATVITPPAISSQPVSVTISSGATATITVSASGSSPGFQWYEGVSGDTASPVPGATGSSFTTPALSNTTSYWVRASNAAGTADSNTVTVTVATPPAISSQPVSVTINSGDTATFTVSASGTTPSFQWYEGISGDTTHPVPGATESSFTTPALSTAASYWVRASNAAGNADSDTVTVTIASFVLTTSATHGIITGAGTYDAMTHATVTATADPGYAFGGWTGDASGVANPLSLLMDEAKSVGATFSPDTADSDGDGLTNYQEVVILATNPNLADSNGNGVSDALEDPDNDGLTNLAELNVHGTNPLVADSNSDGYNDAYAVCFDGAPYQLRIGNKVTFDLSKLITTGQTLKLVGKLPTGLKFTATTGLLTGTLSGKAGIYQASVQVLQGKTIVRTIPFPITVLAFPSSLIGNFDCILENGDSLPSGVFRLTIKAANVWSATLETPGSASKRSAKGTFALGKGTPTAPITAVFAATSTAPQVTITLPLDGSSPNQTGTYSGGTLRGFRLAGLNETPTAAVACSLVLDAGDQDGETIPAGLGWMKGTVSNKGIATLKGSLGDGTATTLTVGVSACGQAVLWLQPYTNKNSFIGGIVTLGNLGQPASSAPLLEEDVWWAKSADNKTLSYPNGFPAMPVTIGASRWTVPASATAMGASLGWRNSRTVDVTIDGGGLSNDEPQATTSVLPTEFTLDDKFALITSAPTGKPPVVWKGAVAKTDGSFTGTLTIPVGFSGNIPAGAATASGVLVKGESWGGVSGCGLIKVPASGPKGSFKTAAMVLEQVDD